MTAPRRPRTPSGARTAGQPARGPARQAARQSARRAGRRRPPKRVFWLRRLVVLGVVGVLVWGVVGLVGMLDVTADGSDAAQASTAGATTEDPPEEETAPRTRRPAGDTATERRRAQATAGSLRGTQQRSARLPEPSGPCDDSDVVAIAGVADGHAYGPNTIELELSTIESRACTWRVDPDSVFVTITDEATTLWSSQDCPGTIPTVDVVPRRDTPEIVTLTWSGKESTPDCSVAADWVEPGTYTLNAVARGAVRPAESLLLLGKAAPLPEPTPTRKTDETDDRDGAEPRGQRTEETEAEAAAREEARREALRQARREHRQEERAAEQRREERREARREARRDG